MIALTVLLTKGLKVHLWKNSVTSIINKYLKMLEKSKPVLILIPRDTLGLDDSGLKEYYEDILNQRQQLNPDLEFESILYLPALAWAQKHHESMDEYPHVPEPNYESGSNTLLW